MRPLAPSKRQHTAVMPSCTDEERKHVDAFLAAFDVYSKTIRDRLSLVKIKDRPFHVQRQIDQAKHWVKLVKWMKQQNKRRKSTPLDMSTIWFDQGEPEVTT